MMSKLLDLKFPHYVEDKYKFALKYYPIRFPHFPTSELALAFPPLFPWWFICGEYLKLLIYEILKPAKRAALIKHDIYSLKEHLHVDIDQVKILSLIHEGGESKGYLISTYLIIIFLLFYFRHFIFSSVKYRKRTKDDASVVVA